MSEHNGNTTKQPPKVSPVIHIQHRSVQTNSNTIQFCNKHTSQWQQGPGWATCENDIFWSVPVHFVSVRVWASVCLYVIVWAWWTDRNRESGSTNTSRYICSKIVTTSSRPTSSLDRWTKEEEVCMCVWVGTHCLHSWQIETKQHELSEDINPLKKKALHKLPDK